MLWRKDGEPIWGIRNDRRLRKDYGADEAARSVFSRRSPPIGLRSKYIFGSEYFGRRRCSVDHRPMTTVEQRRFAQYRLESRNMYLGSKPIGAATCAKNAAPPLRPAVILVLIGISCGFTRSVRLLRQSSSRPGGNCSPRYPLPGECASPAGA